ncbi:MAG: hypothetical protein AB7E37_05135 [Candidatus Altimarinota bacterium]
MGDVVSSFDGSSISFSAKKKGGFVIVKDGNEIGQEYYEILDYSYSDNSIYYIANKSYKGEYILLKDGKEILSINSKPKEIYTSKIGGKYAINLGDRLIINGKETKIYDTVLFFSFSYNGKNYTYQFLNGDGGYKINKDGKELNNYEYMYSPVFSPDGKEFSYIAEKKDGNFVVVKNGLELDNKFESIGYIDYLDKGNNIFYTAEINDKKGLYINNKLLVSLPKSVDISSTAFNSTINGESYVVSYKDKIKLINIFNINGKEFKSHSLSDISDSSFSLKNSDYAITLDNNTSYANIIKNGKKITGYDKTYSPLFLDDGTFTFIGEKNNERYIVINEKEQEIEKSGIYSGIYSLDGKNIIYWIGDGTGKNKKIEIFYLENKDFFAFTDNIANPKNVSKDPSVIGLNGILALLYIFMFYFSGAVFNSYFQESKGFINKINNKLSIYWVKIGTSLSTLFLKILKTIKNKEINNFFIKITNFISKYSHKINIIIGFIVLGIISQILVGELDLNSINGYISLFLLIFIVGLLSLLKDLILYFNLKKSQKEKIKIELIPTGFIFLSIVAIFVNLTKIVPGTLFGATHKLNISEEIKEKAENGKTLLYILIGVYLIGLGFWFSSGLFQEGTTLYKLALTNYFSITSDIFFNLLPFGLFWGVSIFNNKTKNIKLYWTIFMFISFFTLLHTIFNRDGDFGKVLSLQNNNLNIFIIILISWLLVTFGFWFYNKKISKTINS